MSARRKRTKTPAVIKACVTEIRAAFDRPTTMRIYGCAIRHTKKKSKRMLDKLWNAAAQAARKA